MTLANFDGMIHLFLLLGTGTALESKRRNRITTFKVLGVLKYYYSCTSSCIVDKYFSDVSASIGCDDDFSIGGGNTGR